MKILFIIAICIIILGIAFYDKMSYKAMYLKNKEKNTGYYWGGKNRRGKSNDD